MEPSANFILGSQSPRRQQLLKDAGFDFQTKKINVAEIFPDHLAVDKVAQYLAEIKNKAYLEVYQSKTILTADTVVILNQEVLGKPGDKNEASRMLGKLSNNKHRVMTGVCIQNKNKHVSFSSETEVKFAPITDREINYYIENYHPFDKAGAYGIQDWIGMISIEWIKGSFYNVMGLPIDQIYRCLTKDFHIYPC